MLRASEAAINWGQTRLESGGPRSVGVGRSLPPCICAVRSVEPKHLSASVQRSPKGPVLPTEKHTGAILMCLSWILCKIQGLQDRKPGLFYPLLRPG